MWLDGDTVYVKKPSMQWRFPVIQVWFSLSWVMERKALTSWSHPGFPYSYWILHPEEEAGQLRTKISAAITSGARPAPPNLPTQEKRALTALMGWNHLCPACRQGKMHFSSWTLQITTAKSPCSYRAREKSSWHDLHFRKYTLWGRILGF